jgi:hypothetical protein
MMLILQPLFIPEVYLDDATLYKRPASHDTKPNPKPIPSTFTQLKAALADYDTEKMASLQWMYREDKDIELEARLRDRRARRNWGRNADLWVNEWSVGRTTSSGSGSSEDEVYEGRRG